MYIGLNSDLVGSVEIMKKLEFKIDGPALKDGVPIHLAIAALENFQAIIDKTYLVAVGSHKITAKDRERFYLKASEFKTGSLNTYFEIFLQGVQLGLPLVSYLGPQNVWDYTRETYEFLKLVLGAVQRDIKPTYVFNNTGDVSVHIGDNNYTFHAPVYQIGEAALPNYQNLVQLIEPKKLSEISAGVQNSIKPDIYLGREEKKIFKISTRIGKEVIELRCEIFDFNKYKNSGKLAVVIEGQPVLPGEYKFSIVGDQNNVDYIYSMLKPEVTLSCLIETAMSPFAKDKIYRLLVTGVS